MADHPGDNTDEPSDLKSLISTYSIRLWQKLAGPIPTSDSNLGFRYMRRSKKKPGLRLPFNSNSCDSFLFSKNTSKLIDILEDIMEHTISSLHQIRKSLLFWQSLAEATDAQKIYFMMFERGPRAFAGTTTQLLKGLVNKKTSMRHLCQMATSCIYDNITALTNLQICLASFLAELYVEVDKFGESLTNEPDDSLPALLVIIGSLFSKLESTLNHSLTSFKNGHSVVEDSLFSLQLEKVPEVDKGRSNWTENELENAIYTIYQNLNRFDTYLSLLVSKYQKPRRVTQYWFRYTCGAVGLSLCSIWLLRHSRLMGSSDIENWINEAKESTIVFLKDHVEQPLISIRDELFETFKSRQKNVMELEEVQLTADSLHRMLLAFSEQTKGQKFRENASDQEMLGIVMSRYEKELMHPIQNLIGGEIARALLIQIQKLKLDIETAMLELNQILKANEINFAVLAALPAFFLSFLLLYLVRAWATQDKGAEGKGRIARVQRRLLVVEVEKRIMYFQHCMDQGLAEEALTMFGLLLYSLDRLYKAVERHAKETGEWLSLRQDILDLGNSKLSTAHKLTVTSRMERVYDCLLPSTKRR